MTTPPPPAARWSRRLGAASLIVAASGPLVAHLGLVPPLAGFGILALGLLLAVLGTVCGLVALVRGPAEARLGTIAAILPGLVVLAGVGFMGCGATKVPRINDITTDTAHPPEFVHAATLAGNAGRDLHYPGERFAAAQRAGYGEIQPLTTTLPVDETFARAQAAARAMGGWVVTREDARARTIEGVDTSWLFRFQDDFVIEVREDGRQSVVHMRSKSRVGRGDLGANAARIRRFFATLAPRLTP